MGDVNLNVPNGDVNIHGDVVGRDKITVNYNFNLKEWGNLAQVTKKIESQNG
ncbi:MAG: hypothetical protein JNL09_05770 [Anaerolineales bacterium]|nr:hypothetical protein [Anaerolineales bacterium]